MQSLSLKILLACLCATSISLAQSSWVGELEGLPYGEKSSISYIIEDENSSIPSIWQEDLNTGIEYGFKNSGIFSKSNKMILKGGSYLSGVTAAHYMAKIDFQTVKLNEEAPEDYLSNEKTDVYIVAFLKVHDVVNGTLELAKEIIYSAEIKPYDEGEQIAGFFRTEITKALRERFTRITPIYKANIVEEKGDKLKTIFIQKGDFSRMLKPDILFAFTPDKEINGMTTFKQIGAFQKTDGSKMGSRIHLKAKRGTKEILAALKNQTPIYLTRKAL